MSQQVQIQRKVTRKRDQETSTDTDGQWPVGRHDPRKWSN